MSELRSDTCANHRRREAVARCSVCERPICLDCVVRTPVGLKCPECAGGPDPEAKGSARGRRGMGRGTLVGAGIALTVIAGLLFAVSRGPGSAPPPPPARTTPRGDELLGRPVRFKGTDGVFLAGELLVPAGPRPVPGVLIVPGFTPVDRNGVVAPGGFPDPLYRDLAAALDERGIATLRYDRRGNGESRLRAGEPLDFEDLVADARAGLEFLRQRGEIDPARTAIVGHTEGGLVGLRVAAGDAKVAALTLISTPGRPVVENFVDELASSPLTKEKVAELAATLRQAAGVLVATGSLPDRDALPFQLRPIFARDKDAYLQALFSIDPADDAQRVASPALIVWGTRSPRVTRADFDRLTNAFGARAETMVGGRHGETLGVSAMSPLPPPPGGGLYDNSHGATVMGPGGSTLDTRDEELLAQLADWMKGRLGPE